MIHHVLLRPPARDFPADEWNIIEQELAGHTSLVTTQKYIQGDSAAKRNVIKLI
jgi:hypothetical protein